MFLNPFYFIRIQTASGNCASCAGVSLADTSKMSCLCPLGYTGYANTTFDSCIPVQSPVRPPQAAAPASLPVAPPVAAPVAIPIDAPAAAAPIALPVAAPADAPEAEVRILDISVPRPLNASESVSLKKSIADPVGCALEDILLSGSGISRLKRATYNVIVTFTGESIGSFDTAFSSTNATNSTSQIAEAISRALPDIGNVTISIVSTVPIASRLPSAQQPNAGPQPPPTSENIANGAQLSTEVIAGISIGVILFVCLVGLAVFGIVTKTNQHKIPKRLMRPSPSSEALAQMNQRQLEMEDSAPVDDSSVSVRSEEFSLKLSEVEAEV
jgi:hypothetical protein